MEKLLTTVVTIALTCTMGIAHEAKSTFIPSEISQAVSYENACSRYLDADQDGFCDNCNSHHSGPDNSCLGYADIDNDGICDNCNGHHSALNGVCDGYVDADNDGFCDNHAYGDHCPYAPSGTPDNSETAAQSYSGGHHRNSGHHGYGHH